MCWLAGAFCCCFGLGFIVIVDLTQSEVNWEEETSIEKILPFYFSVDKSGVGEEFS